MTEKMPIDQKLKDAFIALYREYPIDKISIKMLTAEVGINRCTFYLHFDDIYALRTAIEEELAELFDPRLEVIMRSLLLGENISEALHQTEVYQQYLPYLQVLYCIPGKSDLSEVMKTKFKKYLQKCLTTSSHYEEYILEYYASAIQSVIFLWLRSGCTLPLEEIWHLVPELTNSSIQRFFR